MLALLIIWDWNHPIEIFTLSDTLAVWLLVLLT
jgi:hypothetical protein